MQYYIFDDYITARFHTLERNIKSISNSFYDSFLDLLESSVKYILDKHEISYDSTRTCGYILKNEKDVVSFFTDKLKLDITIYNKLFDYIKKCNDHKHKKEKNLSSESVINYLKTYFDFINCYFDYVHEENIIYDPNYFLSIFGETERFNQLLKDKVTSLQAELDEYIKNNKLSKSNVEQYQSLNEMKDIQSLNLEEQNTLLQNQINTLKEIKLNILEKKLDRTISMLNNLQDYLVENRILAKKTARLINGEDISDFELKEERRKLEALRHGK